MASVAIEKVVAEAKREIKIRVEEATKSVSGLVVAGRIADGAIEIIKNNSTHMTAKKVRSFLESPKFHYLGYSGRIMKALYAHVPQHIVLNRAISTSSMLSEVHASIDSLVRKYCSNVQADMGTRYMSGRSDAIKPHLQTLFRHAEYEATIHIDQQRTYIIEIGKIPFYGGVEGPTLSSQLMEKTMRKYTSDASELITSYLRSSQWDHEVEAMCDTQFKEYQETPRWKKMVEDFTKSLSHLDVKVSKDGDEIVTSVPGPVFRVVPINANVENGWELADYSMVEAHLPEVKTALNVASEWVVCKLADGRISGKGYDYDLGIEENRDLGEKLLVKIDTSEETVRVQEIPEVEGFWDDFLEGFTSVMDVVPQVIGPVSQVAKLII